MVDWAGHFDPFTEWHNMEWMECDALGWDNHMESAFLHFFTLGGRVCFSTLGTMMVLWAGVLCSGF